MLKSLQLEEQTLKPFWWLENVSNLYLLVLNLSRDLHIPYGASTAWQCCHLYQYSKKSAGSFAQCQLRKSVVSTGLYFNLNGWFCHQLFPSTLHCCRSWNYQINQSGSEYQVFFSSYLNDFRLPKLKTTLTPRQADSWYFFNNNYIFTLQRTTCPDYVKICWTWLITFGRSILFLNFEAEALILDELLINSSNPFVELLMLLLVLFF